MNADFDAWIDRAREADMVEVAERFGAKLRRVGAERIGPCPAGCSTTDGFAINVKDRVFICRKGGAQGDVIALAQHLGGYDFKGAVEYLTGETPPRGESSSVQRDPSREKELQDRRRDDAIARDREEAAEVDAAVEAATAMFESGRPIWGTVVEDYFERRGLLRELHDEAVQDLRFFPRLPYWGFPDPDATQEAELGHFHAMLAAIRDVAGRIIGVHRTFIDPETGLGLRPPGDRRRNGKKKIFRKAKGGLIWLGPKRETMVIGEGIETTLAFRYLLQNEGIGDAFIDASFAAGISLGNMAGGQTDTIAHPKPPRGAQKARVGNGEPDMARPGMALPAGVRRLVLLGDGDSDPHTTSAALMCAARRARAQGIEAFVCFAPPGQDFNDVVLAMGREAAE